MSDFEQNLQKMLEEFSERPSDRCWNDLSERLDAIHTGNSATKAQNGQSSLSSAAGSTSKIAGILGHNAAGIFLGIAAVGITATAIILISNPKNTEFSKNTQIEEIRLAEEQEQKIENVKNNAPIAARDSFGEKLSTETKIIKDNIGTVDEIAVYENINVDKQKDAISSATVNEILKSEAAEEKNKVVSNVNGKSVSKTEKKTETETNEPAENEKEITYDDVEDLSMQPELNIPNVITPNGDNINDYFVIEGIPWISQTKLIIYNRNGRIVYEKRDYDNSWCAENMHGGTYYYIFTFEYNNREFMRKGSIRVIR